MAQQQQQQQQHQPLRVLLTISQKSTHFEQAWSSPSNLLPTALQILSHNNLLTNHTSDDNPPPTTLLAKQRWASRIFLVFDISNPSYDPAKGHLPEQNNLPVAVVRFGGGEEVEKVQAYQANELTRKKVNNDIGRAHNDHGVGGFPPFETDFTLGAPVYLHPRDPALLLADFE